MLGSACDDLALGSIVEIAQLEDLFLLTRQTMLAEKLDAVLAGHVDPADLQTIADIKHMADLYLGMYRNTTNLFHPRIQMHDFVTVVGLLAIAGGAAPTVVRSILAAYTGGRLDLAVLDDCATHELK